MQYFPSQSPKRDGASLQRFENFTLLTILLYCGAWNVTRQVGGAALLAILIAISLPSVKRNIIAHMKHYGAYFAIISIYATLSLIDILPKGWTSIHENSAIPQQIAGYVALPIFASLFLNQIKSGLLKSDKTVIFLLIFLRCVACISDYFILDRNPLIRFFTFDALNNTDGISIVLLLHLILKSKRKMLLGMTFSFLLLLTAGNQSIAIAAVLLMITLFQGRRNYIHIPFVISISIFCIVAPYYAESFLDIDGNTAIRAMFWGDGIELFVQSNFFGIGFGTESIKNFYPIIGENWSLEDTESGKLVFIGLH
ncbi:MAG: hypothetical protein K0M45_09620, partial [Candidatus Paracaedibacteraceae bacterium]|nr:hypothetical protein [Candidatus Paracaedibacteraceae bacterium]